MRIVKRIILMLIPSCICPLVFLIQRAVIDHINNLMTAQQRESGVIGPEMSVKKYYPHESETLIIIIIAVTILYILLYYILKFDKPSFLPLSFILTPIPVFIIEALTTDKHTFLRFIVTAMVSVLYALPCIIITTALSGIITLLKDHRKSRTP